MKWLFYVIVLVYIFYRAVYCDKAEHELTVDPIVYGEEGFLRAGEPKSINCKALNKTLKVVWTYPNKTEVKRIPGNRIFSQEHFVPVFRGRTPALVLSITKAEAGDTGVYQCHAGNFTKNVSLCIIEPVEFVDPVVEVTANIGRSITLTCQAKGEPEPRLEWKRNGEVITDEDTPEKYKVMTKYNMQGFEGLLTITSLKPSDSGIYSCVSIQESPLVEGCKHNQTLNITLNVNYAPVFENTKDTNIYATTNQAIDIVCSAKGSPAPTYTLYKELTNTLVEINKKQIQYSEEKNEAVLLLIANSTTLQHRFKCVAENDLGIAEKFFVLIKMQRPTKVEEVEIFDINDDVILLNLTWYTAVIFPVTTVDVQFVKGANEDKKKMYSKEAAWRKSMQRVLLIKDSDSQFSEFGGLLIALDKLEPETSYWMRFRVTNELGSSPWSDPVFVTTEKKDDESTKAPQVSEEPVTPEQGPSVDDEVANEGTFYGLFFAGGIFVVAFVCMFAMRWVK